MSADDEGERAEGRGLRGREGRTGREGQTGQEGQEGRAGESGPEGAAGKPGKAGPEGKQGARGEKGPTLRTISRFDKGVVAVLMITFLVAAVGSLAALQNRKIINERDRDRAASRNQSCILFERQEKSAVNRVLGTYRYLDNLPDEDYGTTLTIAVVKGLPDTYDEAVTSKAPSYCNAPRVGLPEPGPKLPKARKFPEKLQSRP